MGGLEFGRGFCAKCLGAFCAQGIFARIGSSSISVAFWGFVFDQCGVVGRFLSDVGRSALFRQKATTLSRQKCQLLLGRSSETPNGTFCPFSVPPIGGLINGGHDQVHRTY